MVYSIDEVVHMLRECEGMKTSRTGTDWNVIESGEALAFGGEPKCVMAPEVGLEPTTLALTAPCSTIELLRNSQRSGQGKKNGG